MDNASNGKHSSALHLAPLVIWAALICFSFLHRNEISLERLLNYTPRNPFLSAFVMMLFFALKSISVVLYSGLLYAASGILFSIPLAIVVNICGTIVMALVHYLPSRRFGAEIVDGLREKYPKLKAVDSFQRKSDYSFAVLLRAVNVVNYDIGSIYMGAAGLHIVPFLLGSVTGKLPEIILFPIVGTNLGDVRSAPFWIALGFDIFITLAVFALTKKRFRMNEGNP